MNAPYFVELLSSHGGHVQHRISAPALPIRIGRAYDNDVILDDPHTAPHHAQVELDASGTLVIHDLGSRNGIAFKRRKVASQTLTGDTVVRLGHTWLRVRDANHPVATERLDTTAHSWEGWPPAVTALALIALVSWLSIWLDDAQKTGAAQYLTPIATLIGASLAWSGLWALSGRISAGQARYGRHLFIAACGFVVSFIAEKLLTLIAFAFSLETLALNITLLSMVLGAGMIWFHLTTINPLPRQRFAAICTALAIAGSGLILASNYLQSGKLTSQLYMSTLLPPALHLSGEVTSTAFMADSDRLKKPLDEAKKKPVNGADSVYDSED